MPRVKKPLAQVSIRHVDIRCGGCGELIMGLTGTVSLSGGAEAIRQSIKDNVKEVPYHSPYKLGKEIECKNCGEFNRVPKNWQWNLY